MPRPASWLADVNQPETESEVEPLRECLRRRRPFGDEGMDAAYSARHGSGSQPPSPLPAAQAGASGLIALLRASGHGVTSAAAAGATGGVHVLFTIVERKRIQHVVDLIDQFDPETFYVVEDVRSATRGVFPTRPRRSSERLQTETPRSIPA